MTLIWDESLCLGHPVLDADHKKLFEIINQFEEHSRDWSQPKLMHETLKSLLMYAYEHFGREQRVQTEIRYPYAEIHKAQHAGLLQQVEALAKGLFVTKEVPITAESLDYMNRFLRLWLTDHVRQFDMTMKPYIEKASQRQG